MSPANASNRSRQLALGLVTVLLHLVVFDWFASQLGRARESAEPAPAPPVLAQLIEARPKPPAWLQQPQPRKPLRAPRPVTPEPAPPPLPAVPPEPMGVAGSDGASAAAPEDAAAAGSPLAGQDAATAFAGQAGDAATAADVQSRQAQQAQQGQDTAAALGTPEPDAIRALPEPRRYKVDLPPAADITLAVARIDADGTRWNGDALLSWRLAPSGYRIKLDVGLKLVFARVNLLMLTSEGTLGEEGFVPILMTEKRRGRSLTATHFNRREGTLTFSASQAKYALAPGTQDKASLPLQLTAIARGDAKQLSGNIDILVGEDRDASVFSFVVAGQEHIDTPMGRIATWHFVRPPEPGSYKSRLELWLAPGYGWYPVQIRNVEASGAVTTQTASNIVMKETGS
jgi:hypothetical protein